MKSNRPPWYSLMRLFKKASKRPFKRGAALQMWRSCLNDAWLLARLQQRSRHLVRKRGWPLHWAEEVQSDALMILRRQLTKEPDLGVDLVEIETHFPAWITKILGRHCQEAFRAIRAAERRRPELFRAEAFQDKRTEQFENRMDIRTAVAKLKQPERSVMRLFCSAERPTLPVIAKRLGMDYYAVLKACEKGKKLLQKYLAG